MGPRRLRPHLAALAPFVALLTLPATAQVFVVGMKTATADAVTEFHPTHVELPNDPLDDRGHLDLIRNLEAEQGFAHRELPLGAGLTLIANGNMTPRDDDYKRMLYEKGQSAAPGDRVEISALQFKPDRLILDFNGGPYAKHRFLSHISINNMQLAQQGPIATGFRITLVFEGGLPAVTAAEVKALLDPIIDFKARSPAEAYANTLPPRAREAINNHEILVGMDRRMVIAALGSPHTKHRESATDGKFYEEWIYGEPPHPTQFVRFHDGHVIRLEIAAIGKPIEIRDKNELTTDPEPTLLARTIINGDAPQSIDEASPKPPPTLRLPGEKSDVPIANGRVNMPDDKKPPQ